MPTEWVPMPSIFGRERAVLDGIAKTVHKVVIKEFPHNDLIEVPRGSTFDVQKTIDSDEFVARITIELLPPKNTRWNEFTGQWEHD